MSGGGTKSWVTRVVQAGALVVTVGLMFGASRLSAHHGGPLAHVGAVGYLLLAGTLLSELVETVGLPHISGYLLAGIVGGPHVLSLIDHRTVLDLGVVNAMALALIALAGGLELRLEVLRKVLRSLAWSTALQSTLVLLATAVAFYLVAPFIPFARSLGQTTLIGVALLWGVLAVTRSPSATLGILAQTRAKGPLATFALSFVMSSDVVVISLVALAIVAVHPLLVPGSELSLAQIGDLGYEIVGGVALGTTIGILLAAYVRLVGKHVLLVLLALGFVVSEGIHYVRFDPLLALLCAGFVVQNTTRQGERLLHEVEQTGSVVFVVFFAIAGAHLDLPLLAALWPVALALAGSRVLATWVAGRASAALAEDPPAVRRWGWASLVSQAGLTLGLTVVLEKTFPLLAQGFGALVIATVALNEMIGPVLFKLALDATGETSTDRELRQSLLPDGPRSRAVRVE